jgi:hypothetical protein
MMLELLEVFPDAVPPWLMIALVAAAALIRAAWPVIAGRRRDAAVGRRVPRTLLSRLTRPLAGEIDLIAGLGVARQAPQTLGTTVMRTAGGVRIITLIVSGVLVRITLAMYPPGGPMAEGPPATAAMLLFLAATVLHVFTFEARYDRSSLVVTRLIRFRREYDWGKLTALADDGAYEYVLTFAGQGRARVMKHLVGAPDFLSFVGQQLQRNEARDARTARG